MDLSLSALLSEVRNTLADPRGGARRIIALDLPSSTGWAAVALMAVISTLITYAAFRLSPPEARAFFAGAMESPLRTAFLQLFVMVASVFAIWRLGRARGGTGTMPQTVALVAWLQFVMLVLQVVTLVVQLLVPPIAGLVGIGELALFFWVLSSFVAELHGFRSVAATFGGVLIAMILLVLVMAALLATLVGVGG
jgi:hypothetical protein